MRNIMHRIIILLAGFLSTFSLAHVVDLTVDDFDDFINAHSVVMVEFFAPWCTVCQDLAPIYEDTASRSNPTKDIQFARVDCVENTKLCKTFYTSIYPTIRVFKGASNQEIYNGARTLDEMTDFVERRYKPLVSILTSKDVSAFQASDNLTIIGYFDSMDEKSKDIFFEVAQNNIDYYSFAMVEELAAADVEDIVQPAIILYKQYDEKRVVYNGPFEVEVMDDFLWHAAIPLVAELDKKFMGRYFYGKDALPVVGIFAETYKQREAMSDMLRPVATKFKDSIRFVSVDQAKFKRVQKSFGVANHSTAIAIREANGKASLFDPDVELTDAKIEHWLDGFLLEKMHTRHQSENAMLDMLDVNRPTAKDEL